MKKQQVIPMVVIISLLLLFSTLPAYGIDVPKIDPKEIAKDLLTAPPPPKTLIMGDFTLENVTYEGSFNAENASGKGTTSFTIGHSFEIKFQGVKIQTGLPGIAGKVTQGEATATPKLNVKLGGFAVHISKLIILVSNIKEIAKVDLLISLPTLWYRENNGPVHQAYLALNDAPAKPNLDIFVDNVTGHNLGELGLCDTNIIMNCASSKLTVDLSASKSSPGKPNGETGILFDKFITKPQEDLKKTNIGFCFGEYAATNGVLTQNGLNADLELQTQCDYETSIPIGFKISLNPKAASNQSNSGYQGSSGSQNSGDFTKIPINPQLLNKALQLNAGIDYSKYHNIAQSLIPEGVLRISASTVLVGNFSGTMTLPDSVSKLNMEPVTCDFSNFSVDKGLNMTGLVNYFAPICWGKLGNNPDRLSYGILPQFMGGICYFPGFAQEKFDLSTTDPSTLEEKFNSPNPNFNLPGITFQYFTLGISTGDVKNNQFNNAPAIFIPTRMPQVLEDQLKEVNDWGFIWPFRGDTWVNIGTGVNGKMEIESAIGYHDYPVELGNPADSESPFRSFKSYLHALPDKAHPNQTPPLYEHYKTGVNGSTPPVWAHFFQGSFIDGAVFDQGVDGHFEVDGPSNIAAGFSDLSATSTGELTCAKVSVNAVLDYWGVTLDTSGPDDASRIVPRVSQVFFLGAKISEDKHYTNPFPVKWGKMIGDGNIREFIFGYTPQYFDCLPFSYRLVRLSEYQNPPPNPPYKGSLNAEGDIHFSFFDPQAMTIMDYKDPNSDPNTDHIFEGRHIEIAVLVDPKTNQTKNNFEVSREWGDKDGNTVVFNFPKVGYFDGAEEEDGFGQPFGVNPIPNDWRVSLPKNYEGTLASNIHLTGINGAVIEISDSDTAEHVVKDQDGKISLTGLQGKVEIPYESQNSLPEIKLSGKFTKQSQIVGGSYDPNIKCAITVRPTLTPYEIEAPFSFSQGPISLVGNGAKAKISIISTKNVFDGTVTFTNVEVKTGTLRLGKCNGSLNIHLENKVKYLQGYADITIYGMPFVNNAAGAFFAGYGANIDNLFALDYIDGNIRATIKPVLGSTPLEGFYLACRAGYDFGLAEPLGEAYIYLYGGAGMFNSKALFHGGLNVGIEIMDCGLDASSNLRTPPIDPNQFGVHGDITFTLSLLFFDFSWGGSVYLDENGVHI